MASVPVVTAWRAAMAKSKEGGYVMRVPKFQPRNPVNAPDEVEARVLKLFESSSQAEYFEVDREKNIVRYFRPIRLTSECLDCHGDPQRAKTLWGRDDGRDATGSTAATAEESAAASEELSAQAETTMGVVRRLEGLVSHSKTAAPQPPAVNAAGAKRGTLVKMRQPPKPTAEDEIPLANTGTYGSF